MEENKPPQLDMSPQAGYGKYVNSVVIAHGPSELTFDMVYMDMLRNKGTIMQRSIMSPLGAKMFLKGLQSTIEIFEKKFGVIEIPMGININGPGGQA